MGNDSPQYWRNFSNMWTIPMVVGFIMMFGGLQIMKAHPHSAVPETICTMANGQPCPPELLAIAGMQKPRDEGSDEGEGLLGLGMIIMIGSAIPISIAGNNLQRIKRQVLDYQFAQMQQGQSGSSAPIAAPPTMTVNYATTAYCPQCGEENTRDAKFCNACGKPMP